MSCCLFYCHLASQLNPKLLKRVIAFWLLGEDNHKDKKIKIITTRIVSLGRLVVNLAFKVALYSIFQRFGYYNSINNFSVGKCLSHSTR